MNTKVKVGQCRPVSTAKCLLQGKMRRQAVEASTLIKPDGGGSVTFYQKGSNGSNVHWPNDSQPYRTEIHR